VSSAVLFAAMHRVNIDTSEVTATEDTYNIRLVFPIVE
jgi:hypothetical protein